MGSLTDPKTWIPHINSKDCSQKICTISCKKWCKYIILPSPSPPPPPPYSTDDSGGATLSPVVVVIITLIGSFLFVMGYYFMMSRCCSRDNLSSRREVSYNLDQSTLDPELGVEGVDEPEAEDHSSYVPWVVEGKGLDEALVKSISVCKYKKEDGWFTCTDCSVCLGEFQENECVKVLPKCSHAFHVYCIDTWLKTHLNCPLCRANVCCDVKSSRPILPSLQPPPPLPVLTNELGERDVELEIREEGQIRLKRSKSMDYLYHTRVSLAQVLFLNRTQEMSRREVRTRADVGSSENVLEGNNKGLNFVHMSHFGVTRSYSSGAYMFTTNGG